MNKKALIVVTSHGKLGDTNKDTGWFLSEVSHVYWPLFNAGFDITFASPQGGKAPLEMQSKKLDDEENKRFVEKFNIDDGLDTVSMSKVNSEDFNAIYFAGGHGTMWDFPEDENIQKVTGKIYDKGGLVAAVCHGPSALINVKTKDGSYLIDGKNINSFTNAEEKDAEKDDIVPFLLEDKIVERGGKFQKADKWGEKVVVDGRLLTGQNPQSASALGDRIVSEFKKLQGIGGTIEEQRRSA